MTTKKTSSKELLAALQHSDRLFVNEKGQVRVAPNNMNEDGTVRFEESNMETHPRLKIIKVKNRITKEISDGFILPKRISQRALSAAGNIGTSAFGVIGGLPVQPGTGSGRQSGVQTGSVKRLTAKQLKKAYPNYFVNRPIPVTNIRDMVDPYAFSIRNQFTNAARTDVTIAPAIHKRANAFFRNGFTLELEPKGHVKRAAATGKLYTDEQLEVLNADAYKHYAKVLTALDAWMESENINLENVIRTAYYVSCVQGRFVCKFAPPLEYLEPGALPERIKTISAEETGHVVIERKTEQIVAVRIYSIDEENYTLLPDEFVYGFTNDSALTKYERFYGRSDLEPVIQLARLNEYLTSEGYQKAIIAAYTPKVIAQISVGQGTYEEKQKILDDKADTVSDENSQVIFFEADEFTRFEAYPQQVNQQVASDIRRDIDEICLGAVGSTKSQLSRTENLTRDNATIQEIENERNVVTPDENKYKKFFENQLLNPLFAHLIGVPEEYLNYRVILKRIPDKEDILKKINSGGKDDEKGGEGGQEGQGGGPEQAQQNLQEQKSEDIASGALSQHDAGTSLGASGVGGVTTTAEEDTKKDKEPEKQDNNMTILTDMGQLQKIPYESFRVMSAATSGNVFKPTQDQVSDSDGRYWFHTDGSLTEEGTPRKWFIREGETITAAWERTFKDSKNVPAPLVFRFSGDDIDDNDDDGNNDNNDNDVNDANDNNDAITTTPTTPLQEKARKAATLAQLDTNNTNFEKRLKDDPNSIIIEAFEKLHNENNIEALEELGITNTAKSSVEVRDESLKDASIMATSILEKLSGMNNPKNK